MRGLPLVSQCWVIQAFVLLYSLNKFYIKSLGFWKWHVWEIFRIDSHKATKMPLATSTSLLVHLIPVAIGLLWPRDNHTVSRTQVWHCKLFWAVMHPSHFVESESQALRVASELSKNFSSQSRVTRTIESLPGIALKAQVNVECCSHNAASLWITWMESRIGDPRRNCNRVSPLD